MSRLSFLPLLAGGWIWAAAAVHNTGYAWAYETCASLHGARNHPNSVRYGAIAVVTLVFLIATSRQG